MKPPVAVGVAEQPVFVLIEHSHLFLFFFLQTVEIVGVDEVVAGIIRRVYNDVIFDTSPVAGKVYKNSENRRKQGVSCGFRCISRCSIGPIKAQPERG